MPLPGAFNVQNALAAAACLASASRRKSRRAGHGPAGARPAGADGRAPCAVLRDYAHTPDALERVLDALRPLTNGPLIVVFGAGGDRDRGKRR
jgi:UDP-N-acetylmuramoyl-L-alanyl-D-glutamate--2,6-diaminopimelate ligase